MISEILVFLSGIIACIGAIGLFRFKDFYTRSHASTVISVGGVMFSLFVLMFGERFMSAYFFKILIILIIMLITEPTATHAIANRAYMMGVRPRGLKKNQMESRPGGGRK
ncbi:MAG: sodium:proton antiporter [Candidatus Aenigmatarchaeota archaeon]|mgnify:CR=1 FL=1|nr:MAG: sodium:proton antiporter [Candidatus Aenigmarchaeota archaeon]